MDALHAADEQHRQRLRELAADLDSQTFMTRMDADSAARPELVITNRFAVQLSERVGVRGNFYFWSWGDPLAPLSDRPLAVRRITAVLAAVEDTAEDGDKNAMEEV